MHEKSHVALFSYIYKERIWMLMYTTHLQRKDMDVNVYDTIVHEDKQ